MVEIWRFTSDRWGEAQADKYLDELNAAFRLLLDNPRLAPERNEFRPAVRIYHHARHLIVYRVVESGINVARVLHDRMEISNHL